MLERGLLPPTRHVSEDEPGHNSLILADATGWLQYPVTAQRIFTGTFCPARGLMLNRSNCANLNYIKYRATVSGDRSYEDNPFRTLVVGPTGGHGPVQRFGLRPHPERSQ